MERKEIIPGVIDSFTETGIYGDAVNVWSVIHVKALLGEFDEMVPVKHYEEYFKEQDEKYADAGKPGLYQAVMDKSDPQTVAAFDRLVDEFNGDLEEIIKNKNTKAVQVYIDKAYLLKKKV